MTGLDRDRHFVRIRPRQILDRIRPRQIFDRIRPRQIFDRIRPNRHFVRIRPRQILDRIRLRQIFDRIRPRQTFRQDETDTDISSGLDRDTHARHVQNSVYSVCIINLKPPANQSF